MGRHSSPDQVPYYRSVVTWFLPWAVIAAIAVVAVILGVDLLAGDQVVEPRDAAAASTPSPEESEVEEPSATPTPQRTQASPKPTKEPRQPLLTEGITIQVLNGTTNTAAADAMSERLTGLGFQVIAVEGSSKQYAQTTVFWSYPEAQEAAERLAARFGWIAEEKPANLSDTVAMHVVVGTDEI